MVQPFGNEVMRLEEKIELGMKIFVCVLILVLLSIPLIALHNQIVDFLADLTVKITKYLFSVK